MEPSKKRGRYDRVYLQLEEFLAKTTNPISRNLKGIKEYAGQASMGNKVL